jgi:uncharacterized membrane protein required for colicin V production
MLLLLTLAVMLGVGYAFFREGLLTAVTTLVNVVLAGLVAFNFFEPLADSIEPTLQGSPLAGFEDGASLFGLFALTLGVLRLVTNNLANREIELPPLPQQIGAVGVGLLAGYLVAGFLLCMAQTMPVAEHFLGFEAQVESSRPAFRRLVPPDRVWLAMMYRAGRGPLSQSEAATFDPEGTFELRYSRLRRVKEAPAQ